LVVSETRSVFFEGSGGVAPTANNIDKEKIEFKKCKKKQRK